MIPLKLTLSNFMPYCDNVPPLDFTGIHTATISGDNGSGKSSIIDAITWALWDKTRAKKEDDLIHTNQNEAQVDFEFAVGGQKYRVIRKRARPKKQGGTGQTHLHFYIIGEEGARSLDGDTIGLTQKKIEEVLHMDYETFTNSAYLRQGHADEFTTATPADRKKVLGNILGLNIYEDLEKRAKEIAGQRKVAREQLQNSLGDVDAELTLLPVYEAEMGKAETEMTGIEAAIKSTEDNLKNLRGQKETLEAKKARITQIDQAVQTGKQQMAQLRPQIGQLQVRINEHEVIIAKTAEIEAVYAKFLETGDQVEMLNKNLAVISRLKQKEYDLEKAIEREQQGLVKEHALAQNRVGEYQKTAQALAGWQEELKQTRAKLEQLAKQEENLKQQKQTGQEMLAKIRSLEADKTRLENEITGINEKLHLLKNQPGTAKCPMCGCDLGPNGIAHIEGEFESEKIKKADAIKACINEIKIKQGELKTLSEETSLQERNASQEKMKMQTRMGGLETQIKRAEEAGKQLTEVAQTLQEIEERLTAKNFALAQQDALKLLNAELSKINYDPQKHEQLRQLLESLKTADAPKHKLDEARRSITGEKESLAALEKMAGDLNDSLQQNEQQRLVLAPEIAGLPAVDAGLAEKELELKNLTGRQMQARQKIGGITQRLEYLHQLREKRKEKSELLSQSAKEEQIYRDLAEAFGKKGVQGLLIETAIPEIENEANRLLAKMTDGRMSVKFETQGATQKGDVTETLDIKISDELGIRSYEMFSGGEAFRINFSIRIALSRLLARRAGAPLPTLIIDEGFGTQDAGGIEKLKEAIVSIQDDFEKILVITHIDELKDAFPARIDVTKTPEGSMISLN
ncbi:MAG: SMC family ATPase [Dehalococcoidales bacterium]|nr:SMC family ATPase [Dehalococcoidales bacterium]